MLTIQFLKESEEMPLDMLKYDELLENSSYEFLTFCTRAARDWPGSLVVILSREITSLLKNFLCQTICLSFKWF